MLCQSELGKLFLRSQGQEDTQPQPVLSGAQSSMCFSHLWPLFALMVFTFIEKKHSLRYQRDMADHLFSETNELGFCHPAKDTKAAAQICKDIER